MRFSLGVFRLAVRWGGETGFSAPVKHDHSRQVPGDDFSRSPFRYLIKFIDAVKRKLCFAMATAFLIQIKTEGSKAHLGLAAFRE